MIHRHEISTMAIRKGVPEAVIEKDYCIGWLLFGISKEPNLAKTLVFKGGTALRRAYFPEWRFSEDLDFTAIRAIPQPGLRKAWDGLCQNVYDESGIGLSVTDDKWFYGPSTTTFHVSFIGPLGRTGRPREIKIDISSDERIVSAFDLRLIHNDYTDPREPFRVQVYSFGRDSIGKVEKPLSADRAA